MDSCDVPKPPRLSGGKKRVQAKRQQRRMRQAQTAHTIPAIVVAQVINRVCDPTAMYNHYSRLYTQSIEKEERRVLRELGIHLERHQSSGYKRCQRHRNERTTHKVTAFLQTLYKGCVLRTTRSSFISDVEAYFAAQLATYDGRRVWRSASAPARVRAALPIFMVRHQHPQHQHHHLRRQIQFDGPDTSVEPVLESVPCAREYVPSTTVYPLFENDPWA